MYFTVEIKGDDGTVVLLAHNVRMNEVGNMIAAYFTHAVCGPGYRIGIMNSSDYVGMEAAA